MHRSMKVVVGEAMRVLVGEDGQLRGLYERNVDGANFSYLIYMIT